MTRGAFAADDANDDGGQATTRLNGWLESRWEAWLAASPMAQAYLGRKTSYDRWDDLSEAHQADNAARARKDLEELRANFRAVTLTPEARLSYQSCTNTPRSSA